MLGSEVGVRMPTRVAEFWEEGKRAVLRERLVSIREGKLF